MIGIKPFLGWVGSKRRLIPTLIKRIPTDYKTYFEPFVGGGSLFFALQPKEAILSDAKEHLAAAYIGVRDYLEEVIEELKRHQQNHAKDYYMAIRAELGTYDRLYKTAALFIYLNRACYAHACRVRKDGSFSSAWGNSPAHQILNEPLLRQASEVLKDARCYTLKFQDTEVRKDSFYYFDPPYHATDDRYSATKFTETNQVELADLCKEISSVGSYFMQSNSDTPLIRELYKDFVIEEVIAPRSLSRDPSFRGQAQELLIRNY